MSQYRLQICILGYLTLPLFIFWWGWFGWWIALPATVALVWWLWVVGSGVSTFYHSLPASHGAVLVLLAFGWAYLAGVGGFRPQHFDYFKHNLVLNNLVRLAWPVRYSDGTYLCYYNAYYLLPALLAKWAGGLEAVHWYMFGWAWLGLALLFVQLHRLGSWGLLALFMFFNSPESILLVYQAIKSPQTLVYTLSDLWTNDHTIELIFMPGGLTYPSHAESLGAVPQHAIAGWLISLFFLDQVTARKDKIQAVKVVGIGIICAYWSPFVAVGLLPFFLYKIPNIHYQTWHGMGLLLMALPAVVYYAGHVPLHDPHGWISQFISTPHQYLLLATFLMLESVVWGVLIWLLEKKYRLLKTDFGLVMCAVGLLFVLSLYKYGHFNDLARRASLPATLVLCWGVFRLLQFLFQFKNWTIPAKIVVFVVGLSVLLPIKHHLKWLSPRPYMAIMNKSIVDFTPHTIHYLGQYHKGEFDVSAQYLGDKKSWYWQYAAPPINTKNIIFKKNKHVTHLKTEH